MVTRAKLRVYGMVASIFVLGAGAGAAAGYAMASKRMAEVLGDERPEVHDARRFEALSSALDLSSAQQRQVSAIMQRHRGENRQLTRALFEKCGEDLHNLRGRVDGEIRAVLNEQQQQRFGELMEKRGRRFPLGAPGPRRRRGNGPRD